MRSPTNSANYFRNDRGALRLSVRLKLENALTVTTHPPFTQVVTGGKIG